MLFYQYISLLYSIMDFINSEELATAIILKTINAKTTSITCQNKLNLKYSDSYCTIHQLYNSYQQYIDKNVIVVCKGWIQTSRKQSNNIFIQMYDGSYAKTLQIIFGKRK